VTVQLGNAAKRVLDATPGPWKRWKRMSRHGRAIRFMETYCRPPKGRGFGSPMRLIPAQKEFLEEALGDGIDVAAFETPRGNGKSTFGGGLAVWGVFDDDETGAPQVPVVATTISQAVRSCYGVGVSMIKGDPQLERRALIYTGIATPRVHVEFNGGELFPISNDVDGLQGLDPSLAIMDEMGFQPVEAYDSLRLAAGKRPRSVTVGLGTPGLDRTNALFALRTAVREAGGRLRGVAFHEYATPDGYAIDDPEGWQIANPALEAKGRRRWFLRRSALETDLAITTEDSFRIFRLGQWRDGVGSWLGDNGRTLWANLTDPYKPLADARTWVGVDVGIKRDSTAVVFAQRRPDGHLHAWCKLWVPSADQPVDVTDVMGYLRDLAKRFKVEAISYDPRFFDVPAKMLSDDHLPMVQIDQSVQRMTPIVGNLRELIVRGEIHHDGDPALATHVLNAMARVNDRGFTLQKSKSRGRIDGVIALALAVDRALHARKVYNRPAVPMAIGF
jgi:phage terminase large subunit-like protein